VTTILSQDFDINGHGISHLLLLVVEVGKIREIRFYNSEGFVDTKAELMRWFAKDETVRCPMSGKPLRLKDLIPVTFTLAKDGDERALIAKDVCCLVFVHFNQKVHRVGINTNTFNKSVCFETTCNSYFCQLRLI